MKFKKGKLYALSNPLWGNNILKLGNTSQTIKSRLSTIHTSLYLDCKIVYQTEDLICCKYFEKILEKILASYRIKREFYLVLEEEIKEIYDFFNQLNDCLGNEENLIKYIEKYNPEYLLNKKKLKKKKGLFVDTSY